MRGETKDILTTVNAKRNVPLLTPKRTLMSGIGPIANRGRAQGRQAHAVVSGEVEWRHALRRASARQCLTSRGDPPASVAPAGGRTLGQVARPVPAVTDLPPASVISRPPHAPRKSRRVCPPAAGAASDVGFLSLAIGISAKHGVRLRGVPQEAVSQSGAPPSRSRLPFLVHDAIALLPPGRTA